MSREPPHSTIGKRKFNFDDYKELSQKIVKGWDGSDIEEGYRQLYDKLKKEGWNVPPYRKWRGWVLESSKGMLAHNRIRASRPEGLTDEETELARLGEVLHTYGLGKEDKERWGEQGTGAILDHYKAEAATKAPQHYRHGLERTLEERFGPYNKELSTSDFSVHTHPGTKKTTISFRGSRAPSVRDFNALRDWEVNLKGMAAPDMVKHIASIKKTESDLNKVQEKLGKFNADDYHFSGYSKGGGTVAGAIHFGELFGVNSTSFNPHITNNMDFSKLKQLHRVIRTTEDPASLWAGLKREGSKLKVDSIYPLAKHDNMYKAHEHDNFTNDGGPTSLGRLKLERGALEKRRQQLLKEAREAREAGDHSTSTTRAGVERHLQDEQSGRRATTSSMEAKFKGHSVLHRIREQLNDVDRAIDHHTEALPGKDTIRDFLKKYTTDRAKGLLPAEQTERNFPDYGWSPNEGTELSNMPSGMRKIDLAGPTQTPASEAGPSGTRPPEATSSTRPMGDITAQQRAIMERSLPTRGGQRGAIPRRFGEPPPQETRQSIIERQTGTRVPQASLESSRMGMSDRLMSAMGQNARGKLAMGRAPRGDPGLVQEFGVEAETGSVRLSSERFGGAGMRMPVAPRAMEQNEISLQRPAVAPRLNLPSREGAMGKPLTIELPPLDKQPSQVRSGRFDEPGSRAPLTIPGERKADAQYPAREGTRNFLNSKLDKDLKIIERSMKTEGGQQALNKAIDDFRKRYGARGKGKQMDLEERQKLIDAGKDLPKGGTGWMKRLRNMERSFQSKHGVDKTQLLFKRIMELERERRMAKGSDLNERELEEIGREKTQEVEGHINRGTFGKGASHSGITDMENRGVTMADPLKSARVQAYMAARTATGPVGGAGRAVDVPSSVPGEDARTLMGGGMDSGQFEGILNSTELTRYAQMGPDQRAGVKAYMDKRLGRSATQLENEYARPSMRAIKGGIAKWAGGRSMLAGGAIGLGVGALENLVPGFKDMNEYEAGAITGGLTGGLTERMTMSLAGQAVTGIADVGKIASSALSGGVGLVIGEFATNAIMNAFGSNANPYIKDITANIVGGEIGLLGGMGIASGAAAIATASGIMGAAGVEGTVAAADFWNPVGWGAAIGAAVTAIAGFFVGLFEGGAEAREKKKKAKEKLEIAYAGQADTLKSQYDYIRTYLTQMGMNPALLEQMDAQEGIDLMNKDAKAMTSAEMATAMNKWLKSYSLSDGSYGAGAQTGAQMFQEVAADKTDAAQGMLTQLVNKLNAAGAKPKAVVPALTGVPYDNTSFENAYNKILGQYQTPTANDITDLVAKMNAYGQAQTPKLAKITAPTGTPSIAQYNALLTANPTITTALTLTPKSTTPIADSGGTAGDIKPMNVEDNEGVKSALNLSGDVPTIWSTDQAQIQGWENQINLSAASDSVQKDNYEDVWRHLATAQPNMAYIYNQFLKGEQGPGGTGIQPSPDTPTDPGSSVSLTNAQRQAYISKWQAIAAEYPKLSSIMNDFINQATLDGQGVLRPPPKTTTTTGPDGGKTITTVTVNDNDTTTTTVTTPGGTISSHTKATAPVASTTTTDKPTTSTTTETPTPGSTTTTGSSGSVSAPPVPTFTGTSVADHPLLHQTNIGTTFQADSKSEVAAQQLRASMSRSSARVF